MHKQQSNYIEQFSMDPGYRSSNCYFEKGAYILYSTDRYFFLDTKKDKFDRRSTIRINRLTFKITQLTEIELSSALSQEPNVIEEEFFLLIGVIIVNEEPYLAVVKDIDAVATLNGEFCYQIKNVQFIAFKHKFHYRSIDQSQNEKVIEYIRGNILNDNFYFSYKIDLTLNCSKLAKKEQTDNKYFWNEHMLRSFANYNLPACWKIPIVQGYIQQLHSENDYFSFYYVAISRRSKFMSGTRFTSRGTDTTANAANFVETEEIFVCHNFLLSHVSIRGSAPLFWQQESVGEDIKFMHDEDANERVLYRHYENLKKQYQAEIVSINLLSNTKSPEKELKDRFEFYFFRTVKGIYLHLDLNEEMRDTENGQKIVGQFIKKQRAIISPDDNFFCQDRLTGKIYKQQQTIPRVNCLDCIDRTNFIMSRISVQFLQQVQQFINSSTKMLEKRINLTEDYFAAILEGWAQLGDRISMIYCGTQSLATHLIKQENNSFFSKVTGAMKSIGRYINAKTSDAYKQECINYLLGNCKEGLDSMYFEDNITNVINESKYCTYNDFTAYVLTWNCNNVEPSKLSVKDREKLFAFNPDNVDVLIVCLQQMVQLTTYNVLIGDNQSIVSQWREVIEKQLISMTENKNKMYACLTSYDLVGIATFVFVSGIYYNRVVKQEWLEIKTGFKSTMGNKGAIILFLQIDSTWLTFINCHLAAGETSQAERAQNIEYIHQDAISTRRQRRQFQRSEYRFFIGDMNFRLQAKNQEVREILYTIEKEDSQHKLSRVKMQKMLQALLQKDEFYLSNSLRSLSVYTEGRICFLPTYKYLKKQKIYDTKRTPSWCDRILYYTIQKNKMSVMKYWDIDCYESDHKPVYGIYKMQVKKEDLKEKKRLIELYMVS